MVMDRLHVEPFFGEKFKGQKSSRTKPEGNFIVNLGLA